MTEKKEGGIVKKFFRKLVAKLDQKMVEKAAKSKCGCEGGDQSGGSSCCK